MQLLRVTFVLSIVGLSTPTASASQWWRMGDEPVKKTNVIVNPGGIAPTTSSETASPWIYDPKSKNSFSNMKSIKLDGKTGFPLVAPNFSGSVTIEMYLKPEGDPQRTEFAVFKSRDSKNAAELAFGLKRLRNFRQTYWGAFVTPQNSRRIDWTLGHYVTIARLNKNTEGWRHQAIVYDAKKKTVSCYLDHWLVSTQKLGEPLNWDDGQLFLGDPNGKNGFTGLVDEVRVTPSVLKPAQFLRAVPRKIEGISFASQETMLPRDTGFIDLKEGFGAIGDGKHDDTAAFKKAFSVLPSKVPGGYYTLYVPPGEYLVSDTLHCSRFFVIQGAGKEKTTIRLRDNATGFQNSESPQTVVRATSSPGAPGTNRRVNGSSIGIYVSDLSINTGKNNPGAKGMEYHSNNHGVVENVDIVSGDGSGAVGLDLTHKTNGPALIKNVRVNGFDYGITFLHQEYSMTLEHVTLEDQRIAGIQNKANVMAIRGLISKNKVPAIQSLGGASMITLLDSKLTGGDPNTNAIEAEGALYARNIKVDGYGNSLKKRVYVWHGWKEKLKFEWKDGPVLRGDIEEWWGDKTIAPFGGEGQGSLKLPIEETPVIPLGDIHTDWKNVRDFEHLVENNDWTKAVQAAIDSGAKTVYFPWGGYPCAGTIHLRGAVQRLRGMRTALSRPKGLETDEPLLVYDYHEASHVVVIEHLGINGRLHHSSPATLVVRHDSPARYTTEENVGKLFLENVQATGWEFDHPQQIWCRQWNPESHAAGPCIRSRGATIWSLGFKTEYQSSKLWAFDGAKTEILGAFIYPVNKDIPKDRPVFKNVDSDISLIYGMSVYVANHRLQVDDTQNSQRIEVLQHKDGWAGARFRMDLYTSRTATD